MDWQSVGVAGGALLTATATLITGVYTGRNQARKDNGDRRKLLQEAEFQRETAAEVASKQRIEQIAADATELRKRLRESEDEFDTRLQAARKHGQQGWDLASYYYGKVGVLMHLLNNLFTLVTLDATPERLLNSVKMAQTRVIDLKIPNNFEDPLIKDQA